jgi:hypothetical protein
MPQIAANIAKLPELCARLNTQPALAIVEVVLPNLAPVAPRTLDLLR